jgi:hypothetical protein
VYPWAAPPTTGSNPPIPDAPGSGRPAAAPARTGSHRGRAAGGGSEGRSRDPGGEGAAAFRALPDGTEDRADEVSNSWEVWTGVTYALAGFFASSGFPDEAWKTAEGIYKTTYETGGLWFRTPECWAEKDGKIGYRASMYRRPLAVWAILAALTGPAKG